MFTSLKRSRDEDEEDLRCLKSDSKKIRSLPFRSSPTTKHVALFSSTTRQIPKPPALTPAESSDDDSEIEFRSPQYMPKAIVPAFFNRDTDMDLDMAEAHNNFSSPMWSPKAPVSHLLVSPPMRSPLYPQLLNVGSSAGNDRATASSRIPTPIYGHFSTLQKTTIANATSPTAANPPASGVVRSTTEQHDAFLRRRRLPSPISEDENMDSPTTITKSLLRDLDMSSTTTPNSATFPKDLANSARSSSLVTTSSLQSDMHDFGRPRTAFGSTTTIGSASSSITSIDSGVGGSVSMEGRRRRSDAISGGGSDGGKIVFSMGFRADCDKCREKVPGHYSHVLRV